MAQSEQSKQNNANLIGILGGMFNPPHVGHVEISMQAIEMLDLYKIWWLVSYNHPDKATIDNTGFNNRVSLCENILKNNDKIQICELEKTFNTSYTVDSLKKIIKSYPEYKFIWLIGADNLINFHKWYNWKEILDLVPIAVLDRDNHKEKALSSVFAKEFSTRFTKDLKALATNIPYNWTFLDIRKIPISSSQIRSKTTGFA